jgi:tetratricopeptide (TPR) repeat protein
MRHYTEEELATYAFDPDGAPDRAPIEAHVAECPQCSATLTFIRTIDRGLGDRDAWDITGRDDASEREALRRFAGDVAAESADAETLLRDLLAHPGRVAWANLGAQRPYRTVGVVRRLLLAANEACEREPLDALTFADAAIDIAERLSGYPPATLHDLRGIAWKERANALRFLGQFESALDALTRADHEFRNVPGEPLGPASVQHARGVIFYERGELGRANEALTESAATFAELGEIDHFMRARHVLGNVRYREQDIHGAVAIYEEVLAWAEGENDLKWMAREHRTLGHCARQLGDFSGALQHFHLSILAFRELGLDAEVTRTEWGFALIVLASGRPADALARLTLLRTDFHRRQMLADEALIAIDMMDALHLVDDPPAIVALAGELMQTFTEAGMLTSALTAFAYLRDAARRRTLRPTMTAHVRDFLRRLEHEPGLLFVPVPDGEPR